MATTDPRMPNGLQRLSRRERHWLRHHLPDLTDIPPIPPGDLSRVLNRALRDTPDLLSTIQSDLENMLVPDGHLEWIKRDDQRLLIWLLSEMDTSTHPALNDSKRLTLLNFVSAEDRYEEFVLTMDRLNINLEAKKQFLRQWKEDWATEACPNSEIDWIDPKDDAQLRWAWEYLQKKQEGVAIPSPVTNAELYGAVVASLDRLAKRDPAVREHMLDKMRRTWAQRKYRESPKAKKQHHLPLTKQTHRRLEWLSENWACRKSEVLERLINQAYELSS